MTTIAGVSPKKPRRPPPAGSKWERIELAREELEWSGRDLGREALGEESATGYNTIQGRGWKAKDDTAERIIARLVKAGYRETWLRMGELPAKGEDPRPPEEMSVLTKLRHLARRLDRKEDEIVGIWAEVEKAGPLENLPDEVRRAAFAAAYMEGRSLADVAQAVAIARKTTKIGAGVETWLSKIRFALMSLAPSSGARPMLSSLPPPRKANE